ncbi:hypothetical protein OG979_34855 [Actinomadura citrea]|uniref:hypothetical protein n=1 Tax=Actinomadura citrea TaxID=46158 RepID=UPI002E28B40C|nr:hypothetical protein [Actinomadura citrea]
MPSEEGGDAGRDWDWVAGLPGDLVYPMVGFQRQFLLGEFGGDEGHRIVRVRQIEQPFPPGAAQHVRMRQPGRDEQILGNVGFRLRDLLLDGPPGASRKQVMGRAACERGLVEQLSHADRGDRRHVLDGLVWYLILGAGHQAFRQPGERHTPRVVESPDTVAEQLDEQPGHEHSQHQRRWFPFAGYGPLHGPGPSTDTTLACDRAASPWRILHKPRCRPHRAGHLAKAIHTLQPPRDHITLKRLTTGSAFAGRCTEEFVP